MAAAAILFPVSEPGTAHLVQANLDPAGGTLAGSVQSKGLTVSCDGPELGQTECKPSLKWKFQNKTQVHVSSPQAVKKNQQHLSHVTSLSHITRDLCGRKHLDVHRASALLPVQPPSVESKVVVTE